MDLNDLQSECSCPYGINCKHGVAELDDIIEKLPPKSIAALKLVMDEGGWVKYNRLSKEYGEENDSYFWETEPPTSTVGILRLHGLLFVGKSGIGGRNYKVCSGAKGYQERA